MKTYLCIDLKSFYASVECVSRNLDPLKTNLVVADSERTDKTICLAVTPSLKQYGLSGRARLFEVIREVKNINYKRKKENNYKIFSGKSFNDDELKKDKSLELDFIVATPRMKKYIEVSSNIYSIYLNYLSPEDIYVYSIDEVFCDITNYLKYYNLAPSELATKMIKEVYKKTGITATAGIGPNMYLAKVCMDIVAKKSEPNEIGVRIASIDDKKYRKLLWNHRPITDFWRVGRGIAKKLEQYNMYTMGDVARCSINNENLLYNLFGVNAELLIDHAWGIEPVTLEDVKKYKPKSNSISSGQVLHTAYDYSKTKLIIKEMMELLSLDLVEKKVVTNQLVLDIGYDIQNLKDPLISKKYFGEIVTDYYGRKVPKNAHGTINLVYKTASTKVLTKKILELYDKIINPNLLVKRLNITACNITNFEISKQEIVYEQLNLFDEKNKSIKVNVIEKNNEMIENKLQNTIIAIKNKYGKNSILKVMNLKEGGTTIVRNMQVGGHRG